MHMSWTPLALIGIVLLGAIGAVFFRRRRERRFTLTAQAVRCPVHDDPATLAVRTLSIAHPGHRFMDVTACSLLPATSFVPPTRTAYFPDAFPCEPYISEVSQAPHHCAEMACRKGCLHVLNAADRVVGAPIHCASGTIDSMELARQTQRPEMMRQIWLHST
jgi:LPXTG-motif cell wall-anchored protein